MHEVRLSASGLERLCDEAALSAQAGSTTGLSAALARLGEPRLLYLIRQEIDLGGGPEHIEVAALNPHVAACEEGPRGWVPLVNPEWLGAEFHLAAARLAPSDDPVSAVRVRVNLSASTPGAVGSAEDATKPVVRRLECSGLVVPPQPSVFVVADASTGQAGVAYLVRVAFRPVEAAAVKDQQSDAELPFGTGR